MVRILTMQYEFLKQFPKRMKHVGMIANYILPNYEVLHTESREHVTDNMIECLITWESKK